MKRKINNMTINARQRQFCINYAISNNGTQSYLEAYDPKGKKKMSNGTAGANASKMLKNPEIQEQIKIFQETIIVDKVMDAEEILKGIQEIATNKANKNTDRLQALNMLGKAQGMFIDRVSNEGNMDVEINLTGFEDVVKEAEVIEEVEMESIEYEED